MKAIPRDDDINLTIREMYQRGDSYRTIAEAVRCGVGKVSGRVRQMGLPLRGVKLNAVAFKPERKAKSKARRGTVSDPIDADRRIDPFARPGCEWISGDPGAVRYGLDPHCGAERLPGRPYCAAHARIAYRAVRRDEL